MERMTSHILWKIKFMFQTTNQYSWGVPHRGVAECGNIWRRVKSVRCQSNQYVLVISNVQTIICVFFLHLGYIPQKCNGLVYNLFRSKWQLWAMKRPFSTSSSEDFYGTWQVLHHRDQAESHKPSFWSCYKLTPIVAILTCSWCFLIFPSTGWPSLGSILSRYRSMISIE